MLSRRQANTMMLTVLSIIILVSLFLTAPNSATGPHAAQNPGSRTLSSYQLGSPLLTPSDTYKTLGASKVPVHVPSRLEKQNPSFHLLLTNTTSSLALCRTILASTILDYPPPTLIASVSNTNGTPMEISPARGIHNFLHDQSHVKDRDLVLVLNGSDTWLQLPSYLMLQRYGRTVEHANEDSKKTYGSKRLGFSRIPVFPESVVWAASRRCISTPGIGEFACRMMPAFPDAKHPDFPSAGAGMGSVAGMKTIYDRVTEKLDDDLPVNVVVQTVLTELLAEQEASRRLSASSQSFAAWTEWIFGHRHETNDLHHEQIKPTSLLPDGPQEFGMTMDHAKSLFQTANEANDVFFVTLNDSAPLHSNKQQGSMASDILQSAPPFQVTLKEQSTALSVTQLDFNATLDFVPTNLTWRELNLAASRDILSIPVAIHAEYRDQDLVRQQWQQMWFYPYARAMLRNAFRTTEGAIRAKSAASGGDDQWDTRGGKGGVWTQDGSWLAWGEICRGHEDELFGDGQGLWRLEGGDHPKWNEHGYLVSVEP